MPRKEYRLLAQDIRFFLLGGSDAARAAPVQGRDVYPLDWSFQLDRPSDYFEPFDAAGVPLRDLPGAIERQYLPSRIAAYALANWNRWAADNSTVARERFLASCNWFAGQEEGAFRHDFSLVGMSPGWLSCIAQGEGVSVLVRGLALTGDERMANAARKAADWLGRSVAEGGLLAHLPDGGAFLEEYPGTQYRHVLNGCLYALVGLDDLVAAGLDPSGTAAALRDDVIASIERNLPSWEIGDWTTYDFRSSHASMARANPNTLTYQTVHWILLDYLAVRLDRPLLAAAAGRWKAAGESFTQRAKALGGKLAYRLGHGYGV
jgi:hypothetical protein